VKSPEPSIDCMSSWRGMPAYGPTDEEIAELRRRLHPDPARPTLPCRLVRFGVVLVCRTVAYVLAAGAVMLLATGRV
jgi:hypothetical protein